MPHRVLRILESIVNPHLFLNLPPPSDTKTKTPADQYLTPAQVLQQYKQSRDRLARYNRLITIVGACTVVILTFTIVATVYVNDRTDRDIDFIQKVIDLWVEYVTLLSYITQTENGYRGYVLSYNLDTTAYNDVQAYANMMAPAAAQFNVMLQQENISQYGQSIVNLIALLQHETEDVLHGMTSVTALYQIGDATDSQLEHIYDTLVTPFTLNGVTYTRHCQVYNSIHNIMLSIGLDQQDVLYKWTTEVTNDVDFTIVFSACLLSAIALLVVAQVISVVLQRRASHRIYADLALSLQQANSAVEMKSNFLATMSHELRSPMNGVVAMAELLATMSLDEEQADILNTIRISGSSMMTLIDDLLTFSKMEAGKFSLSPSLFKLDLLLKDVGKVFTLRTSLKNLEFQLHQGSNLPTYVFADQGRLRQCLVNLCDNSLKFTASGHIRLTVRLLEETVNITDATSESPSRSSAVAPAPPQSVHDMITLEFSVSDTGIGISDTAQQQIFKPFVQADMSTTRKYGGTGLGLSIVRELVELMQGQINVRSTVGTGSCFYFTIKCPRSEKADDSRYCTPTRPKPRRIHGTSPQKAGSVSMPGKVASPNATSSATRRRSLNSNAKEIITMGALPELLGNSDIELVKRSPMSGRKSLNNNYVFEHKPSFSRPGSKLGGEVSTSQPSSSLGHLLSPTNESTSLLQPYMQGKQPRRVSVPSATHANTLSSSDTPAGEQQIVASSDTRMPNPQVAMVSETLRMTGSFKQAVQKLKILLVEDNPINQKVAMKLLSRHQHHVILAENGLLALNLYKEHLGEFDCVLMDVHMPVMDGLAATRAIREYESTIRYRQHNPVHIVSMTAGVLDEDRAACKQAGMNAFLSKPFTISLLDARLRECMQKLLEREMGSTDNSSTNTPTSSNKARKPALHN